MANKTNTDAAQQKQKAVNQNSDTTNSNTEKDPDEWTTGGEPMTGAQKSYLKTLSDEAGEEFDENLKSRCFKTHR